ncbi:hypothetical protein PYCC9005_005195 [Savitreella phatthalungensis]
MSRTVAEHGDLRSYGRIVLFGDSITEQAWNIEWGGHAILLSDQFSRRLDVINRGFSGYTTRQALALHPRIFGDAYDDDVKLIVVFFGANDAALPGAYQHVPLEEYLDNLGKLLASPQLRGKTICVTPPPLDEHGWPEDRTAAHTAKYARAARALCEDMGVPCADVWGEMMREADYDGSGDFPGDVHLPRNAALQNLLRDGLHPSPDGYRLIYNLIATVIRDSFPDVNDAPRPTPLWRDAIVNNGATLAQIDTRKWTDEENDRLKGLVDEDTLAKVGKFYFDKDRRMALGSALLQRWYISQILGVEWAKVVITRDDKGRPSCASLGVVPHDYNVTHHGGKVVLAGIRGETGNFRIGVDLTECTLEDRANPQKLLADFHEYFTEKEWAWIGGDAGRFYAAWALKEAYVKWSGDGIGVDLKAIESEVSEDGTAIITGEHKLKAVLIKEDGDKAHYTAVAGENWIAQFTPSLQRTLHAGDFFTAAAQAQIID